MIVRRWSNSSDPRAIAVADSLAKMSIGELLGLSRRILAELRRRGVIRSGNAPAGDYAELLVQRATGGELAANAQKSWDVETSAGEHLHEANRCLKRYLARNLYRLLEHGAPPTT